MFMLLIGIFAVAGVEIGWYGHKANLRIEAWGRKADERDLIFQQMSEPLDVTEHSPVGNSITG